ncbi:MAG: InlB B-repeat-containing protein [Oscillospiraceae bacterium]|jgi:uncharacterized repeat protein (TIGR02543 family)|nr:InlB B-repeat-containing protein [Oscillospiraceae bacterium]
MAKLKRTLSALLTLALVLGLGWIPANAEAEGGGGGGEEREAPYFVILSAYTSIGGAYAPLSPESKYEVNPETGLIDITTTPPVPPTITGAEFVDWIDSSGNTVALDSEFPKEDDTNLFARYKTGTVTYKTLQYADSESAAAYDVWQIITNPEVADPNHYEYENQENLVIYDNKIPTPGEEPGALTDNTASKTAIGGFVGWYTAETGGKLYDFEKTVSSTDNGFSAGADVVLYARYSSVTFYVKNTDGDYVIWKGPMPVVNGRAVSPGTPLPVNDEPFSGWYKEEVGGSSYNFNVTLDENFGGYTENAHIYARYRAGYRIEFLDAFGHTFKYKYVQKNASATELETVKLTNEEMKGFPPKKEGSQELRFKYWALGSSSTEYDFTQPITSNITLTPILSATIKYVTFSSQGSQVPFQAVESGQKATKPTPDPKLSGYTFAGWYTTKDGNTTFNFNAPIEADTTAYAHWTPAIVPYTVIVWKEKPNLTTGRETNASKNISNGVIDANTSIAPDPKNYDVVEKITSLYGAPLTAMAESAIPSVSGKFEWNSGSEYQYFESSATRLVKASSDKIKGDGTTVINIYYRRKIYTLSFNLNYSTSPFTSMTIDGVAHAKNEATTNRHKLYAKLDENIASRWPVPPVATFLPANTDFYGWQPATSGSGVTGNTIFVSKRITLSTGMMHTNTTDIVYNSYPPAGGSAIRLHYLSECLPGEIVSVSFGGVNYKVLDGTNGTIPNGTDNLEQTIKSTGNMKHKELTGMRALDWKSSDAESVTYDSYMKSGTSYVKTTSAAADLYFFYKRNTGNKLQFDMNLPNSSGTASNAGMLPLGITIPVGALAGVVTKTINYDNIMFGEKLNDYEPLLDPEFTGTTDDGKSYRFGGWYTESTCMDATAFYIPGTSTNDFETHTMPDGSLTLFAKWIPESYVLTISDDVNGGGVLYTRERELHDTIGKITSGDGDTDYSRDSAGAPDPSTYQKGVTKVNVGTLDERTFLGWYYQIGVYDDDELEDGAKVEGGITQIFAKWSELAGDIRVVYETGNEYIKWNWWPDRWPWDWIVPTGSAVTPPPPPEDRLYKLDDTIYLQTPSDEVADLYRTNDGLDKFAGWELGQYVDGLWVPYYATSASEQILDYSESATGEPIYNLHEIPSNAAIKISEIEPTWITVVDEDNQPTYKVRTEADETALVEQIYPDGRYIFFRPVFEGDNKIGIIYDASGGGAPAPNYGIYVDAEEHTFGGETTGPKYNPNDKIDVPDIDAYNDLYEPTPSIPEYDPDEPDSLELIYWKVKVPARSGPGVSATALKFYAGTQDTYLRPLDGKGYVWSAEAANVYFEDGAGNSKILNTLANLEGREPEVGDVQYGVPRGNYIILEPVWGHVVTFDANRDHGPDDAKVNGLETYTQKVAIGETATKPSNSAVTPSTGGFTGKWFTKNGDGGDWGDEWIFTSAVTENLTLYAQWGGEVDMAVRPASKYVSFAKGDDGNTVGTASVKGTFYIYVNPDDSIVFTSAANSKSGALANFLTNESEKPKLEFFNRAGAPITTISIGDGAISIKNVGIETTGDYEDWRKFELSFTVSTATLHAEIGNDRIEARLSVSARASTGGTIKTETASLYFEEKGLRPLN